MDIQTGETGIAAGRRCGPSSSVKSWLVEGRDEQDEFLLIPWLADSPTA